MNDRELVLAVLAGQSDGYLIDPYASAFQAVGFRNAETVARVLAVLETEGFAAQTDGGWSITIAGRQQAPTDAVGAPEPLPEPSVRQRVLVAIDALDPATATVADVIAALKEALAA